MSIQVHVDQYHRQQSSRQRVIDLLRMMSLLGRTCSIEGPYEIIGMENTFSTDTALLGK